jgi:hemolysin activation/secretion protein
MRPAKPSITRQPGLFRVNFPGISALIFWLIFFCWISGALLARATEPSNTISAQAIPGFDVETYSVVGGPKISMDVVFPILSQFTGTNISLEKIVEAAEALQTEYHKEGYTNTSVAIPKDQITNGIVTMNVFQAALPQVVVSGVRYFSPTNSTELPAYSPPIILATPAEVTAVRTALLQKIAALNNAPSPSAVSMPKPATPAELAADRESLFKKLAEVEAEEKDHRIHAATTNAGPRFDVEHYVILGNSVLLPQTINSTLTNIDGAFGTNVSFAGIQAVVEQLQEAYHDRGFATVAVTLPQQKLTNATVKLQVLEGRLSAINVVGNEYFSSNNIMRALPSLHNDIVINAPILQAELNQANANQDRQIYPVVGPGPVPGTSQLTLKVKDRLPLHAKVEVNNENSPGTPVLRVNTSAVYNNLWQHENSLGVQYNLSPEEYKREGEWNFYDQPSVVNYSAFYRLPLGTQESMADRITANPGTFGYSEATRKFNLPPSSNRPELTFYASRATINTGLGTLSTQDLLETTNREISLANVQEDITANNDLGTRLDYPLIAGGNFHSGFSGGLDFKTYQVTSYKTNNYLITSVLPAQGTGTNTTTTELIPSAVPTTIQNLDYLPLSLHYDASWVSDPFGSTSVGLDMSVNLWYSSEFQTISYSDVVTTNHGGVVSTNVVSTGTLAHRQTALQDITGSAESTGHWVILRPSFSQMIPIYNWTTLIRADGQWANEPLISNEQFGAGGVNSVRGYHEGEVFGDDGWHVSLEEQTPPQIIGTVYGSTPLTVRGSIYMDYADVYLIDPEGRQGSTPLWGTGLGFTVSAGSHWQSQWLFSVPLISTPDVEKDQFYFNFSLTAQF